MASNIILFKLEKTTKAFVENLNHFEDFTPLSAHSQWLPAYKIFNLYEPYFVKVDLTYFDVKKAIQKVGYELIDVAKYECGHGSNGHRIIYPENRNLKLPDALDYIQFDIKVKEMRRYELYWEYVASMRTYKKPLQQQLMVRNVPVYTCEEYGIYHPEVNSYRGGLNPLFYDHLRDIDNHITNQAAAFTFFDQYAELDDKIAIFKAVCEPFIDGETFISI